MKPNHPSLDETNDLAELEKEGSLPNRPISDKKVREYYSFKWHWSTPFTHEEIAKRLGVDVQTVYKYLKNGPKKEVEEMMTMQKHQVRMMALEELREQFQTVAHQSKTAETDVKIYTNDQGDLVWDSDVVDGQKRVYKIPQGFEMVADEKTRYFRRAEAREIIDQLVEITGAGEPEEQEKTVTLHIDDDTAENVDDLL